MIPLNQWQTLYSHLRVTLGRDPFKVIRLYKQSLKDNAFRVSLVNSHLHAVL